MNCPVYKKPRNPKVLATIFTGTNIGFYMKTNYMIHAITDNQLDEPKEKDEDLKDHELNEDDEIMDEDEDDDDDEVGYDILPSNGPGLAGDDGEQVVSNDE